MTVYHGGYIPVKNPEIPVEKIQKILEMDFTVRL